MMRFLTEINFSYEILTKEFDLYVIADMEFSDFRIYLFILIFHLILIVPLSLSGAGAFS